MSTGRLAPANWSTPAGHALRWAFALLALALVWPLALSPAPARAQAAPSVVSTSQQNNFPRDVDFSALIEGGDQLASAVLFYRVLPEGAITRREAEIVQGDVTRIEATMPTNRAMTWIPAGADVEWYWELTASDGAVTETEPQIWRYEDPRYAWQPITGDNLVLYYYGDNRAIAERLHREGEDAITEMSALLNIELDFPARVYMWAGLGDATGVERVESQSFEEQVLTGGTRVLADLVHIFQPTVWVVRHELTHILTKVAGEGGIGSIPAWLDEGTATYAESDWRARRGGALAFFIEQDDIFTVRSMGSTSNVPGRVDLFYGQAADLVTFLVNRYGEDSFADLFAVFKRGSTVDNALLEVYGFDRAGLTAAYREFVGLPPLGDAQDQSTIIEDDAVPQQTPADETESAPQQADAEAEQSTESGDAPQADADAEAVGRSDEEIAERRAEIERRLATRRPAPVFAFDDGFPWEGVATGLGAGVLLAAAGLFFLVLRAQSQEATATAAGPAWTDFRPPDARSPDSGPPDSGPPDSGPPDTRPPDSGPPAGIPPPPAGPRGASSPSAGEWSGWRRQDDDPPR